MPALKGQPFCFAHHPETRAARSAARTKGGANRARPTSAAPPARSREQPAPEAFDLGELRRHADIAPALLRLAQAIARGAVDPRRGRLLTESLRAAAAAFIDSPDIAADGAPLGARAPNDDELQYLIEHGELPDGVQRFGAAQMWVTGREWVAPASDGSADPSTRN